MKTIVLDVETKKSFDDVGGRDNLTALGVSVAGAYFYETDSFYAYEEHELPAFEARLEEAELVIGFNINNFDWPVLQPYFKTLNVLQVPTLDIRASYFFKCPRNSYAKLKKIIRRTSGPPVVQRGEDCRGKRILFKRCCHYA